MKFLLKSFFYSIIGGVNYDVFTDYTTILKKHYKIYNLLLLCQLHVVPKLAESRLLYFEGPHRVALWSPDWRIRLTTHLIPLCDLENLLSWKICITGGSTR